MKQAQNVLPRLNRNLCDGCGACVEACPEKALYLVDCAVAFRDNVDCPYCGECEVACPTGAIERVFTIEFGSDRDLAATALHR
jgi:hypothetical protein